MTEPIDEKARESALNLHSSVVVRAPAGSGKTELLVQRCLGCLSVASRPEAVLAITFTNLAAAEMKRRVLDALAAAAGQADTAINGRTRELAESVLERDRAKGWRLRQNPHRLRVTTIDALNAALSAQLPLLTGVGAALQVDSNPRLLYEQATYALLADFDDSRVPAAEREAIGELLANADYRYDRLIPLLCELLERREQWIGSLYAADPMGIEQALVGWIRRRLEAAAQALDPWRATLTSALAQAHASSETFREAVGVADVPEVSTDPETVVAWRSLADLLLVKAGTLRKKVNASLGFAPKEDHTVILNQLLSEWQDEAGLSVITRALAAVRDLPDPEFPAAMENFRGHLGRALERLYGHLMLVFAGTGKVDFTEVAARAQQALGNDDPSDALLRMDYRLEHLLVDEFQDTSRSQIRLLSRIMDGWQDGDGRTFFAVGDPMQSIYLFREAEVRLFVQMLETGWFEHIPLQVVHLEQNFRSDEALVEWCNEAFRYVLPDDHDPLTGEVPFAPASAIHSESGCGVTVHPQLGRRDRAEAESVAAEVAALQAQYPEDSMAVLVRTRGHLREILPALQAAGVSYQANEIDPIGQRGPVEDLVCLIRALRHPMDRLAWLRVLRSRVVGIGWTDAHAITQAAGHNGAVWAGLEWMLDNGNLSADASGRCQRLMDVVNEVRADPGQVRHFADEVRAIWLGLGGESAVDASAQADVDRVFRELHVACPTGVLEDMRAFEAGLQRLFATPTPGGVEVMTIHAAKGLEFDTVFVPGLGHGSRADSEPLFHHHVLPEGFVITPRPHGKSVGDESAVRLFESAGRLRKAALAAEARRLLYVALTRARKRLHLFAHANGPSKSRKVPAPPNGSMCAFLWPVIADAFEDLPEPAFELPDDTSMDAPAGGEVPAAVRLPADARVVVPAPVFEPVRDRAERPSEMIERGEAASGIASESKVRRDSRICGRLYHDAMPRVIASWPQWNAERVPELLPALRARAAAEGIANGGIDRIAQRTAELLQNTLDDRAHAWMFAPSSQPLCEYALSGYVNGEWISVAIDLLTRHKGVLWVIDYKSSHVRSPNRETQNQRIAEEVEHYRRQVEAYLKLVRRAGFGGPLRGGLYFPDAQVLAEVGAESGQE